MIFEKFFTNLKCFFQSLKQEIQSTLSDKNKRKKALNVAQTRLSEDGSPTHSYEMSRKVPLRRLEKGLRT